MKEDLSFQNTILDHLNTPDDTLLAQKVKNLRTQSPENEKIFQDTLRIWETAVLTKRLQGIDYKLSVKKFRTKLSDQVVVKTRSFGWLKAAAAIAVVTAAAFWFYPRKAEIVYVVKETKQQIDSVALGDGTKVILAANSAIRYPDKMNSPLRQVTLVKGQAFFKVHRDEKRPFSVGIGQSKVTVLGTSFNINYTKTAISLAVKTGKVMFAANDASASSVLVAGQALKYDLVVQRIEWENGANANSWVTRRLEFVDMPLDEVCKQLSAYYNVHINLNDSKHAVKKFNANFTNSSLEEVLAVLKQTYKIKIDTNENNIITINY